jgi:hypothetical protein
VYGPMVDRMEHQMNITLPDTITVPLGRNGKYGSRDIAVADLPEAIHAYVFEYGLRQTVNDAMADKTDDDGNPLSRELIVAKADKRIDALKAGTVRQRGEGSAEPLDPVEAEAWRIAKADLVVMVKDVKVTGLKGDKALLARINVSRTSRRLPEFESLADTITAYLATPKGAAIMKRAQRNVAERAKAVDMAEAGI